MIEKRGLHHKVFNKNNSKNRKAAAPDRVVIEHLKSTVISLS